MPRPGTARILLAMTPDFDSVFISSIQTDFEDVRASAREGVESFGCRALMAETAGASPGSSRAALLDLVERADVLLLIVGPRHGDPGASGRSPTEEEFDHARSLGKDILVLVQDGPRDAEAEAFLQRVQGTWESGYYAPRFTEAGQVLGLVVRSLRELEERRSAGVAGPAAIERARQLVSSDQRGSAGGARLRVAFVPVGSPTLLDAVALEDAGLADRLIAEARAAGVLDQAVGVSPSVSSDGVALQADDQRGWVPTKILVAADGAIAVEADVAAEGMLGSGQIDHDRVVDLVECSSAYAQRIWSQLDDRDRVRQAAAVVGVPEAEMKLYVTKATGTSSRIPMGNPTQVTAPEPPIVVRREDVGAEATTERLVVSLKRAFADLGAVD